MTEVVAALLWKNQRFLICRRPPHKARGNLYEFVGGKVEPGETKEQALIRECSEELAVSIAVGKLFLEVTHQYPDLQIHLTVFHATILSGTPTPLEHTDLRWITPEEMERFQFCPADQAVLARIAAVYGGNAQRQVNP